VPLHAAANDIIAELASTCCHLCASTPVPARLLLVELLRAVASGLLAADLFEVQR
jgi:hypothetical protein